jgi:hypothetical protein
MVEMIDGAAYHPHSCSGRGRKARRRPLQRSRIMGRQLALFLSSTRRKTSSPMIDFNFFCIHFCPFCLWSCLYPGCLSIHRKKKKRTIGGAITLDAVCIFSAKSAHMQKLVVKPMPTPCRDGRMVEKENENENQHERVQGKRLGGILRKT